MQSGASPRCYLLAGIGMWTMTTFSNRIASSSPAAVMGVDGRVMGVDGRHGVVGVGDPSVLDAARPCRFLMIFLSLCACRFSRASIFTPGVTIIFTGAWGFGG